jgi:hypothetical protein
LEAPQVNVQVRDRGERAQVVTLAMVLLRVVRAGEICAVK